MKSIENLMYLMKLGYETFQKKRLALVLKISSNTSLDIASNMINLPFLVAAVLSNGKEQFLCPVLGEHQPRLQDLMCDMSYKSYTNKMLRVGMVGFPPYFAIQEQKIVGVDMMFLKFLEEKKSLQSNINFHKTFVASIDVVCMKNSQSNMVFPVLMSQNILF